MRIKNTNTGNYVQKSDILREIGGSFYTELLKNKVANYNGFTFVVEEV